MNLQQLEYVLAVHQHKHFGNAADSCHITQATLSAMIKKLEEEIGFMIFDRTRNQIKTTDVGLQLVEKAKEMLTTRNEIMRLGCESLNELKGEITLGVIPTIANSLLPLILPPILKENPELKLTVSEITTEEIIKQLKLDQIELGILATPLNEEMIEESIIYYEAMMVYGVKASKRKYISSKDIQNQKIWLLEEGNCFREQTITICDIKAKESEAKNLNFAGSSFETLLNLTDKFGGFTLIPELYFNTLNEEKQALTKSFHPPIPVREISIVANRPHAKKRSIEYLTNRIKEIVLPHLITSDFKAKDLEIIGI